VLIGALAGSAGYALVVERHQNRRVARLAERLARRGVAMADTGAEIVFDDPWRNRIRVSVEAEAAAAHR